MTTSGTVAFNPSLGELCLFSFNLAQIRPSALMPEHMQAARMATNLILSDWSQRGVNLWKVDLVTQPLTSGVSTYSVDASTISMLDAYIEQTSGSETIDRIILPISRTEYASYPNKAMQGQPTVFWFDRLLSPTVTIWPVPPDSPTYSLKYYRLRQIQDGELTNGTTMDIPYRWLNAFADRLAWQMARIYTPAVVDRLKADSEQSYAIAAGNDVEQSQIYISPMLGGYFS